MFSQPPKLKEQYNETTLSITQTRLLTQFCLPWFICPFFLSLFLLTYFWANPKLCHLAPIHFSKHLYTYGHVFCNHMLWGHPSKQTVTRLLSPSTSWRWVQGHLSQGPCLLYCTAQRYHCLAWDWDNRPSYVNTTCAQVHGWPISRSFPRKPAGLSVPGERWQMPAPACTSGSCSQLESCSILESLFLFCEETATVLGDGGVPAASISCWCHMRLVGVHSYNSF